MQCHMHGLSGPAISGLNAGVAPSGSMQPVLAPSVGVSALPVLVPSAAPLPAPCEVGRYSHTTSHLFSRTHRQHKRHD